MRSAPRRLGLLPLLFLLLPLLLGGCLTPSEAADHPVVQARAVGLHPEREGVRETGLLRLEAGFALSSSDPRFGGLSGLWLEPGGRTLIAVSDRGVAWSVELEHDEADRLVGFGRWRAAELAQLPEDVGRDAEALTGDGQGGLVVAYEGRHRLRRYPQGDLAATPVALPVPDALALRPGNAGIEALATLDDGSLLALSEGLRDGRGLLGWRIGEAGAEPLHYVPAPDFVPTGADRAGDVLYVVERRFSWLGGFGTRIAALPAEQARAGAVFEGAELARLERPLISDNFEGIAARPAADGRVLLYVLSDDNFIPLQRTLLLQFSLPRDRSPFEEVGQRERQVRDEDDEAERHHERDQERPALAQELAHGRAGDRAGHEHQHPDRGG